MHIPYVVLPPINLDAVGLGELDWFSVFVLVAVVLGVVIFDRACLRGGDIDAKVARLMPEATIVSGFLFAHLVHVLLYHPELMKDDPWVLVKMWAGMSSMGGFFGGLVGAVAVARYYKKPLLPYADRLVFALTVAWILGRLGCATAHDHPGAHTDFFLAVAYPDGPRHDLGFYELLFTLFVLAPLLLWLTRKPWRTAVPTAAVLLSYAPVRFGFDFLRATDRSFVDARYLGLTPAQYATFAMLACGLGLLALARRRGWAMQPALWGRRSAEPTVRQAAA